jgi:hypothetical protein
MKKATLLASIAVMSISGNAMALLADPLLLRPISVAGQAAGTAQILALGPGLAPAKALATPESCPKPGASCSSPGVVLAPPTAPFGTCLYRLRWYPVGGKSFIPCDLNEISTSTSWGCYFDQTINYATLVSAGPSSVVPTPFCAGFDQYGISYLLGDITLVMGEIPFEAGTRILPNLFGTVVYPASLPFPQSISL